MKFKSLKTLSILGFASLTIISCGSKPKSISCDGLNILGATISYTADQEKISLITSFGDESIINFADIEEITVEGSKIIINDNDSYTELMIGKGPYELSLETCPKETTPAVQYFIP